MMVIASRSSTAARVSRKIRSAPGRCEPMSASTATAKAMSVAVGIAQPPSSSGFEASSTVWTTAGASTPPAVHCPRLRRRCQGSNPNWKSRIEKYESEAGELAQISAATVARSSRPPPMVSLRRTVRRREVQGTSGAEVTEIPFRSRSTVDSDPKCAERRLKNADATGRLQTVGRSGTPAESGAVPDSISPHAVM